MTTSININDNIPGFVNIGEELIVFGENRHCGKCGRVVSTPMNDVVLDTGHEWIRVPMTSTRRFERKVW